MFGLIPAVRLGDAGHTGAATWWRALAGVRGRILRRSTVQTPARTALRPSIVPDSLDDLRGPAEGIVELPVRLYWSAGSRRFDLSSPHEAADYCESVLDAASSRSDLVRYLNAGLLVQVWPVLGLSRAKRAAWEDRFPVLRRQRLAAAA